MLPETTPPERTPPTTGGDLAAPETIPLRHPVSTAYALWNLPLLPTTAALLERIGFSSVHALELVDLALLQDAIGTEHARHVASALGRPLERTIEGTPQRVPAEAESLWLEARALSDDLGVCLNSAVTQLVKRFVEDISRLIRESALQDVRNHFDRPRRPTPSARKIVSLAPRRIPPMTSRVLSALRSGEPMTLEQVATLVFSREPSWREISQVQNALVQLKVEGFAKVLRGSWTMNAREVARKDALVEAVRAILRDAGGPLSVVEISARIHESLHDPGRRIQYRVIPIVREMLLDGLICRVEGVDGERRYSMKDSEIEQVTSAREIPPEP